MSTVIRSMDYGEGDGPDYRIHFEVTSPGCPAQTYGPPERCSPAEPPEWSITCIERDMWEGLDKAFWVPIERVMTPANVEAVYAWAETLDLCDEVAEAVDDERAAEQEWRAEQRADALEEIWREKVKP